jgi:hypothetical protein
MNKYSEVIILCEDIQQEVFARTFLVKCGIPGPRIYTAPLPKEGAGESFVRRQYPKEVKAYRQRANRMNLGLVVMVDADNQLVEDRFVELNQALQEKGLPIRQPTEKIGIFVPRRNIETWIHFLMGHEVDETTEYAHFTHREGDCRPHVKQLAQNRHNPLPNDAPLSLQSACQELPRIFPEEP